MALDPNIILGAQAPQNPVDSYAKAMTIRDLMQKSQLNDISLKDRQREANDQQAVRDAYKNNLVTNPDGTQSINKAGVLSDLGKYSPLLQQQEGIKMQQTSMAQLQAHREEAANRIGQVNDQASYNNYRNWAAQSGAPNADHLPQQYDPSFVGKMQLAALPLKEQIAQRNKEAELANSSLEARAKAADAGIPYGAGASGGSGGAAGPAAGMVASNGKGIPSKGDGLLDADPADLLKHVPMKDREKVAAQIDAAKNAVQNGPKIMTSFDGAYDNGHMADNLNPLRDNADQKAYEALMGPTFKDVEGTVRQAAMDNMYRNTKPQPIADMSDSSTRPTKRNAVVNYLQDKSAASLAKNYGIDLSKYRSTNVKAALAATEKSAPSVAPNFEHMTDAEVKAAYDKLRGSK